MACYETLWGWQDIWDSNNTQPFKTSFLYFEKKKKKVIDIIFFLFCHHIFWTTKSCIGSFFIVFMWKCRQLNCVCMWMCHREVIITSQRLGLYIEVSMRTWKKRVERMYKNIWIFHSIRWDKFISFPVQNSSANGRPFLDRLPYLQLIPKNFLGSPSWILMLVVILFTCRTSR